MGIFAELKRRNVIRVALFYIIAAWVVVQVAETVLPVFDVPDAFVRGTIVVLAIGFIPALIFAWIFELTPEGLRVEREASAVDDHPRRAVSQKLNLATLLIAFFAIALFVYDRVDSSMAIQAEPVSQTAVNETAVAPARSIAVLAFEDLSPLSDQEYFADGVSEELLNLLARIDGFKVAARTSSFQFKDSDAGINEIGQALNVETVLEGSVRKAGDQVRVTAQLINVADGFHLWSDTYDRRLENIFAVQDEIAAAIVNELRLQFDVGAQTAARTTDVEAYDRYLRGRELAREPTRDGLLQAIQQYDAALALDPDYAAAHAGIATAWVWLEDYGGVKSSEAFPKAEQAAQRALALDENSAEAHGAMAFVLDRYYDDKAGASEYFERTLELNPNYVLAYNLYADTLRDMGQLDRMVEVARRASRLDPLSAFTQMRLAGRLISVGQVSEAKALVDALLAEQPSNDYALEELGNILLSQGDLSGAIAAYRRVHVQRPGDPYPASQIAEINVLLGDEESARAWLAEARAQGSDNRWELEARSILARSLSDWPALDEVGDLLGGHEGTEFRGEAAVGQQRWAEARRHYTAALRMSGYTPGQTVLLQHVPKLVGLEFVDRQLGLDTDPSRLERARGPLEGLVAKGSIATNDLNYAVALAQIAALQGQREEAIRLLTRAPELQPVPRWQMEDQPIFSALQSEPDFQNLLEQADQRQAEQQQRASPEDRLP